MKRSILVGLWVASVVLVIRPSGKASGDPPLLLRNYQFLTNFSTLHQTGGFAGVDYWMPITGGFGLVTGYDFKFPPPQLVPIAQFIDVDAVAHHPIHDFPIPIDGVLNLSGLDGTFDSSAPHRLLFEGVDGQGAPMHVRALLYGRLMLLSGANNPGCCDFFNYEINAVALQTPFADFNSDSRVDGGNFRISQENFGQAHPTVLGVPGDANGDSRVDGLDFLIWQHEFGTDLGGASSTAVPEPPAGVIVLLMALVGMALRRNGLGLHGNSGHPGLDGHRAQRGDPAD